MIVYSGFLGGSSIDVGSGVAVDDSGAAFVTGSTWSSDFPIVAGLDSTHDGYSDVFMAKVNADGSALVYSTFLGGADRDHGEGIAVDGSGAAYLTGNTQSAI